MVRYQLAFALILSQLLTGSVLAAESGQHQVRILGAGNEVELDPATIPPEMQPGYQSMKMHCLGCHGQERMITTLRTGISPVTKLPYKEVEFRDKTIKIMRGSHASLDREHAKVLIDFFTFLVKKANFN